MMMYSLQERRVPSMLLHFHNVIDWPETTFVRIAVPLLVFLIVAVVVAVDLVALVVCFVAVVYDKYLKST